MQPRGEKKCGACGEMKSANDFHSDRSRKHGLASACKSCLNHRNANYKRSAKGRATAKRYRRGDAGRAARLQQNKVWRDKNPEKKTAQNILNYAVRVGRIIRPETCSRCGAAGRIEAHHHDYAKPLDVQWLCVPCHKEEH